MIFLPSPLGRLSSFCEEKQFPLFYILDLAVDLDLIISILFGLCSLLPQSQTVLLEVKDPPSTNDLQLKSSKPIKVFPVQNKTAYIHQNR